MAPSFKSKVNASSKSLKAAGGNDPSNVMGPPVDAILVNEEKKFLLMVERGDYNGVRRMLEPLKKDGKLESFNLNCTDPLGRTSMTISIENESFEMIEVLLEFGINVADGLLHAISEDYVEAAELLLEWEEKNHKEGTPYSWETLDTENATFTPDITPLILAAHRNSYEILKLLLDRGASLPMPHDVRCGCDECVQSMHEDSLRHSRSRYNAYRALSSPSLIALSSKDPILTAFELSNELGRLAIIESEFTNDYTELEKQCQTFSTALLDHVRTSYELETLLNYSADGDVWEPGDRQTLARLELAIRFTQKDFVAHPNVQQLLSAMWYQGLPGFRRKTMLAQLIQVASIAASFPIYSMLYILGPTTDKGSFLKKPFIKFICHSASYLFFLSLLALASQRIEYVLIEWFGPDWLVDMMEEWKIKERGSIPGPVELFIMMYVCGNIWSEVYSLYSTGLKEYLSDLWNIIDLNANMFFVTWMSMRAVAFFVVLREQWAGHNPWYPREEWNLFDPMLVSEAAFCAAMIFSYLKTVNMFSINPHLGPLQISLGRMIIDIIKFFFIYMLVLFAFGCGMNQLLWYYADMERKVCYSLPNGEADFENNRESCIFWRRFANLFETSQSLFWASFGLVDLESFELTGIKGFTRFWGLLMFGSYSMINIIVLLNMLIAMMSNSYQIIQEKSDTEWKFSRSKLWLNYFDEGGTVPSPFNLIPSPKNVGRMCGTKDPEKKRERSRPAADTRHMEVMRQLVRRYVTAEQKKSENSGVTEDDVNEIKQDISSFRCELIDILKDNGMKAENATGKEGGAGGRKNRVRERRLMKGFQIGLVEDLIGSVIGGADGKVDVFGKLAKAMAGRGGSSKGKKKEQWNAIAASKQSLKRNQIGSKEAGIKRSSQLSLRRSVVESERAAILSMNSEQLVEYNPRLKEYTPATRVAYAKFKARTLPKDEVKKKIAMGSKAMVTSEVAKPAAKAGAKPAVPAAGAKPAAPAAAAKPAAPSAAAKPAAPPAAAKPSVPAAAAKPGVPAAAVPPKPTTATPVAAPATGAAAAPAPPPAAAKPPPEKKEPVRRPASPRVSSRPAVLKDGWF